MRKNKFVVCSKNIVIAILFNMLIVSSCHSAEKSPLLKIKCDDISWGDVEDLAEPYMSEVIHTALIGQALSSEYNVAAAADQALTMDKPHPEIITRIMKAIRDCWVSPNSVVQE